MSQPSKKEQPQVLFGMRRTPVGWQVIRVEVKDGRVVREKASEPENRALALETFQRDITELWDDV